MHFGKYLLNAAGKILTFLLVSVAESCFVRNPEDRFCRTEAHMLLVLNEMPQAEGSFKRLNEMDKMMDIEYLT